jgi:hypothetical protein
MKPKHEMSINDDGTCNHETLKLLPEIARKCVVVVSDVDGISGMDRSFDAQIVGIDGLGDIAVLKIDGIQHTGSIEIDHVDDMHTGDDVMIIGNPYGMDFQSCAVGRIRDNHWTDPTLATLLTNILTDVSTSSGSSGSPIINMAGKCVGMHTGSFNPAVSAEDSSSTTFGGGIVGYQLARISDMIIDQHMGTGESSHIEKVDQILFYRKGILPFKLIANTVQNQLLLFPESTFDTRLEGFIVLSASDNCDIRRGDVISHINGVHVGTFHNQHAIGDVTWWLGSTEEVSILYKREGEYKTTAVQLYKVPSTIDETVRVGAQGHWYIDWTDLNIRYAP